MSSRIRGPQTQIWPPRWPLQTSAARNAPALLAVAEYNTKTPLPVSQHYLWCERVYTHFHPSLPSGLRRRWPVYFLTTQTVLYAVVSSNLSTASEWLLS